MADAYLDARADAYGHSLALIGPVARDLGVTGILVSSDADASTARGFGFSDAVTDRIPDGIPLLRDAAYGTAPDTRAVMRLEAEVIAVKHVEAGAGVSYGYTHRTSEPTTLALIGLGYADGVPRLASNRASVLLAGSQRPLVGRIAMDQLVLSCGSDEPTVGEHAILFGAASDGCSTLGEWAAWTERDPLDIPAGLGNRIQREAS